jgi:RNA polymerase sigma factor (sigma-70 family)
MSPAVHNDAELVHESLAGNREAFGQIVARYQSLVCSLAFSATGSLSQSEDLAQETFVAAWRQLRDLREPDKLRSWLCRIARNLTSDVLRQQGREPSHCAESLEEIAESPAPGPQPAEQTMSNEEQAILWRSLEKIPGIYREPLVLFYREHQSIEAVAQNLDLSEDAVKQRLSRGRKMLHEQVLAFVEGALEKTAPGKNFTVGVVAALPLLATTTKAATVGSTVKGGAALKMLFMTKTTQAIMVAAVTVTAVLTTQTIVHRYRAAGASERSPNQVKLAPQEATEAVRAARDFLEANGKGDWNAVAKFWPANAPAGKHFEDIFTDQNKGLVSGLQIVSLGTPYRESPNSWVMVPYEVRLKSGDTQKNNLRIGKGADGRWIWQGGF